MGSRSTEEPTLETIGVEARAVDRERADWRRLDRKAALALRRRIQGLRKQIQALRKRLDPEGDPDHDRFVDIEESLGDAAADVARALRALSLAKEAETMDDGAFLDWLDEVIRDGLPVGALWRRATGHFGKSRGRAERLFALDAWEDVPDPTQVVPLLESAAAQGDSIAAAALMHRQPERRDEWRARAIELRDQRLCLEEGREHTRAPRTPERLARAAELFAWAVEGSPGPLADEAYAYLSCLHALGWLSGEAPPLPESFRPNDERMVKRVRQQFGL